jgi:SRSO17 transposase
VFLGYACAAGRALLDVRLYLPRSWVADRAGVRAAGIPANIEFATKPQLALQMIAAPLRAGITTTAAAPTRPPAHRSQVPLPY